MSDPGAPVRDRNDCGCCEGLEAQTPVVVWNAPGLSALAYRAGTHSRFRESMLANLSTLRHPALRDLGTRAADDFAIALVDAWATVADVLTFYQERIANESYLRTATERRSVLELARAIGYELRPGAAASTYLAFELEEAPGSPSRTTIDLGTKGQSVPEPGQQAQVFETVEKIEARAVWNRMRPRLTQPQVLTEQSLKLEFAGLTTALKPGDGLLLPLTDGQNLAFRVVAEVIPQPDLQHLNQQRTLVRLADMPYDTYPRSTVAGTGLFGSASSQQSGVVTGFMPPRGSLTAAVTPPSRSSILNPPPDQPIRAEELHARAQAERFSIDDLFSYLAARRAPPPTVAVFRTRAALFGHNAPPWDALPKSLTLGDSADSPGPYKDRKHTWAESNLADYADFVAPSQGETSLPQVFLDNIYPGIARNNVVLLRDERGAAVPRSRHVASSTRSDARATVSAPTHSLLHAQEQRIIPAYVNPLQLLRVEAVQELSWADFTLAARVSRLTLSDDLVPWLFTIRGTTVYGQPEELPLARLLLEDPIPKSGAPLTEARRIELDGWVDGLVAGQAMVVSGELATDRGVRACEVAIIDRVEHDLSPEGGTWLTLRQPLEHQYVRQSVTLNANVARATHGESTQELLGSGDAGEAFQRFALRQPPLTHVGAATPSGTLSTLRIYVNDLQWHEMPSFFGHGPEERIFITRLDDEGRTSVLFGDGKSGARLPSGQANVRAGYRKGIGTAGLLAAGQLSQLLSRPGGVRGVTNPLPTEGGDDREALRDARRNAPLTVLTLDRVVSLQDYSDFARAFTGIAKASAEWVWIGQQRGVLVTVAGPRGAPVLSGGSVHQNLLTAIRAAGDPHVPLRLESYRPRRFRLAARFQIDPDYREERVLAAVEAALRAEFSFEARDFGQPVALSEVEAVIQNQAGVVMVDVNELYWTDVPASQHPYPFLAAEATPRGHPAGDTATARAAELLTLDPAPLSLETVK
jgi:hypothetical protein